MCKNCCKIRTYLNFAKRARNIIYGADDIIKSIKKCHIILASDNLGSSSLEKLKNVAQKSKLRICVLEANFFKDKIESETIKAVAITDKNLSDAIKNELD